MRRFVWDIVILISCCAAGLAHAQPLEVDQAEVLRLGDTVQHVAAGVQAADDELAALGPPASDADKWFISLVTTKGCAACEQLKRAWRSDPWLLALASPDEPGASWAHYNEYLYEDRSQAFRWEGVRFNAFPTVLVQPPRSGRYGDGRTVVFQDTFHGDPKALAEGITQAIRRYVNRLNVVRPAETGPQQALAAIGQCPWDPPPKPAPYAPGPPSVPVPDWFPLQIPPEEPSLLGPLRTLRSLRTLLDVVGALAPVLLLALAGYVGWRLAKRSASKPARRTSRKRAKR